MKTKLKRQITGIAERWREQYETSTSWRPIMAGDSQAIYQKILESTSLDEVDAVIGNRSWTHDMCTVCNKMTRKRLYHFDVCDYHTAAVCKKCLKKALKELSK